jgi:cytoskeleton protein RodZ
VNEGTNPENQINSLDPVAETPFSGADVKTVADLLSDARKGLGLSQQDVAAALYLDVNIIAAIEQRDYHKIPRQVFLKGYLRSIAKVVGLDEQEIVNTFDKESRSAAADMVIERATDGEVDNRFTGHVVKTGLFATGFLGLLLLLTWTFLPGSHDQSEVDADIMTQQQVNSANQLAVASIAEPVVDIITAVEHNAVQAAQVNEVVESQSIVQEDEVGVPEAAEANADAIVARDAEPLAPELPEVVALLTKVITSESTALDEGRLLEVDAGGHTEIEINFSGDCWLEIIDGDREIVYSDLNGSGDILRVRGIAPFELLFGNATVASLYYRGVLIDLTSRTTRELTARIKLPANEANL